MSKAGSRILEGAREALAVAKGEAPAASITFNGHRYVPADRITALEKENAELRGDNARMRSERLYIIGFNDGWESAHEQQPGDDRPFGVVENKGEGQ